MNWLAASGRGGRKVGNPLFLAGASSGLVPLRLAEMQLNATVAVRQRTLHFPFSLARNTWQSQSLELLDDAHSLSSQFNAGPESKENSLPFDRFSGVDECSVLSSQGSSFAWPIRMVQLAMSVS